MARLLLIANDPGLRTACKRGVGSAEGLEVCESTRVQDGIKLLDGELPRLIVADIDLPGGRTELVRELVRRDLPTPMILASSSGELPPEIRGRRGVEGMKKPVTADPLAQLVRRMMTEAASAPPEQATFSVADFLQLAGIARRSVVLDIVARSGERGRIMVHEGQAYAAEDRGGAGQEAFYRLALLEQAQISCSPLAKLPASRNVEGSLEELLLEAVRLADERGRRSMRDPPAPSPPPQASEQASADSPPKESTMPGPDEPPELSDLLRCSPELRGIARANPDGAVLDSAGEIDSEVTCAVTAMVRRSIGEVGELLGLGDPADWHFSAHDRVWYVVEEGGQFVVADGNRSRAPSATMKRLVSALGEGR